MVSSSYDQGKVKIKVKIVVRLPSRLGYDRMIRVSVESGVEYTQSSKKF